MIVTTSGRQQSLEVASNLMLALDHMDKLGIRRVWGGLSLLISRLTPKKTFRKLKALALKGHHLLRGFIFH
jgi:hypothetical protein